MDIKFRAGFMGKDAMRDKAERAFAPNLVNPKRAAIQETQSAKDSTPVRKYAKGGPVVNEKRHPAPMQQGVRQDGKLYKEGGAASKTDKKVDKYLQGGLYGRKNSGKTK